MLAPALLNKWTNQNSLNTNLIPCSVEVCCLEQSDVNEWWVMNGQNSDFSVYCDIIIHATKLIQYSYKEMKEIPYVLKLNIVYLK